MGAIRQDSLLSIARNGLTARTSSSRSVVIVGAGMAGLVAGYELQRAGYQVVILEATQRAGGRVLTLRDPFTDGLYGEAGAMRVPLSHHLTQTYIHKFGLPLIPFTRSGPNSFFYLQGQRHPLSTAQQSLAQVGLDIAGPSQDQTILQYWHS